MQTLNSPVPFEGSVHNLQFGENSDAQFTNLLTVKDGRGVPYQGEKNMQSHANKVM